MLQSQDNTASGSVASCTRRSEGGKAVKMVYSTWVIELRIEVMQCIGGVYIVHGRTVMIFIITM